MEKLKILEESDALRTSSPVLATEPSGVQAAAVESVIALPEMLDMTKLEFSLDVLMEVSKFDKFFQNLIRKPEAKLVEEFVVYYLPVGENRLRLQMFVVTYTTAERNGVIAKLTPDSAKSLRGWVDDNRGESPPGFPANLCKELIEDISMETIFPYSIRPRHSKIRLAYNEESAGRYLRYAFSGPQHSLVPDVIRRPGPFVWAINLFQMWSNPEVRDNLRAVRAELSLVYNFCDFKEYDKILTTVEDSSKLSFFRHLSTFYCVKGRPPATCETLVRRINSAKIFIYGTLDVDLPVPLKLFMNCAGMKFGVPPLQKNILICFVALSGVSDAVTKLTVDLSAYNGLQTLKIACDFALHTSTAAHSKEIIKNEMKTLGVAEQKLNALEPWKRPFALAFGFEPPPMKLYQNSAALGLHLLKEVTTYPERFGFKGFQLAYDVGKDLKALAMIPQFPERRTDN